MNQLALNLEPSETINLVDRSIMSSGVPGAPSPKGHVKPPNDWRCHVSGCERHDLPVGYTRCVEHRGGVPYDQALPESQWFNHYCDEQGEGVTK